MVYKTELQPREVYAGTSFDRAIARVKRVISNFRCPISADMEEICMNSSYPDIAFDAYVFAYVKHNGQTRFDGGPYMRHPGKVGEILYEAGIRQAGVIAPAFLHDVIEGERDRKVRRPNSFERLAIIATRGQQGLPLPGSLEKIKESDRRYRDEIERKFGWSIASVVEILTPLPKSYYTKEQRDFEMYKRLEELGNHDLRPLLIKGADCLQNLFPGEIALMEDTRAIAYAEYSGVFLELLQENLPELGWYSSRGEEGIEEEIINPLEQRIRAVIAERRARLAEKRERAAAGISTEFVPAK